MQNGCFGCSRCRPALPLNRPILLAVIHWPRGNTRLIRCPRGGLLIKIRLPRYRRAVHVVTVTASIGRRGIAHIIGSHANAATFAATWPAIRSTARAAAGPDPIAVAVARVLASRRVVVPLAPIRLAAAAAAWAETAECAQHASAAAAKSAVLQATLMRPARIAA